MNGRKKVDCFSSPNDEKLDELLKLVSIFAEWKNESLSNKKEFIPMQSYEDLCWIIFAKVGVCSKYLRDDASLLLVPGRSGSDVVEHHFGHIRQTNAQPSIYECRQENYNLSKIITKPSSNPNLLFTCSILAQSSFPVSFTHLLHLRIIQRSIYLLNQ